MAGGERGQVVPLVALVMVVAGLACLAVARLGGAAAARAQAVTAADAAALAGAAQGRRAAHATAAANGGRLVAHEQLGSDTRVRVELGGAIATARARRHGGIGRGEHAPALRAALARASQLLGAAVPVVPAAGSGDPGDGDGRHRRGLAVDVPAAFVDRLSVVAGDAGLCQPYPATHPVHFELCLHRLP